MSCMDYYLEYVVAGRRRHIRMTSKSFELPKRNAASVKPPAATPDFRRRSRQKTATEWEMQMKKGEMDDDALTFSANEGFFSQIVPHFLHVMIIEIEYYTRMFLNVAYLYSCSFYEYFQCVCVERIESSLDASELLKYLNQCNPEGLTVVFNHDSITIKFTE